MVKSFKRTVKKMFREYLVHHYSSLEYRAKLLTLMVSANGEITECEKQRLKEIAYEIYGDDQERGDLLIDTVYEYHTKIITNNGLDFEHLIQVVEKETKSVKRFVNKIDMRLLSSLKECIDEKEEEEEVLYVDRLLEFLQTLKDEYGDK